jgi:excisionase family DNA binding protein
MRKRGNAALDTIIETRVAVTVDEAAVLLSVGRWTIYQMMASGDLPSLKLGRSRRIPVRALLSLAAAHGEQAS